MISRLIIAAAIALFFTPGALVWAQEHPEHPKKGAEHPKKAAEEKQVSTADISAGIKKNIDAESKKSSDGKFHVKYEGQDLALDLIKVHDDRLLRSWRREILRLRRYERCRRKDLRHRFLSDRTTGQNERHRDVGSQDRRKTSLQLERRKRKVAKSIDRLTQD